MHWYYISDFSVGIFYNILNRMAILCILVLFLFLGSILPMLTGVYAAISQLSVYMSYWPLFSWSIFLIWKICWQKKVEFCFMSSCQWNHHIDVYLMIQHTYGFIFFELTLNPWKISNLITVNSPFDRLLKSVCQCSVEDRYAHQKLVSFFFFISSWNISYNDSTFCDWLILTCFKVLYYLSSRLRLYVSSNLLVAIRLLNLLPRNCPY